MLRCEEDVVELVELPWEGSDKFTIANTHRCQNSIGGLMPSVTVPGSHGRAIRLDAGETVRVVNTHGTQVVDFWAVRADRIGRASCRERVCLGV